jgi:hypothetical protein
VSAPAAATSAAYHDLIQRIYVAYFGRPADPAGLAYWADQFRLAGLPTDLPGLVTAYRTDPNARAFVDLFGASKESSELYAGDNDAFITAIYRNIFSRDPDAAGKAFWVATIDSGAMGRAIAAITLVVGARSEDVTIINNKVAAATIFTETLKTEQQKAAYDGTDANAEVRIMLGRIALDADAATSASLAQVTLNSLLETKSPDPAARYVPFANDRSIYSAGKIGLVPSGGGQAIPAFGGAQVTVVDMLMRSSLINGNLSKVHPQMLLAWDGQHLLRQELVGNGMPATAQVSSISYSELCSPYAQTVSVDGTDMAAPSLGWRVFRRPGPDSRCMTGDDQFAAVRMDMPSTTAPKEVSEPVLAIHGNAGELVGWLVRDGQRIMRVDSNFAHPAFMFSVPGPDLKFEWPLDFQPNLFLFVSGGVLYAWDGSASSPGAPTIVAKLDAESLLSISATDPRDVFFLIGSHAALNSRLIRYDSVSRAATELTEASALGQVFSISLTPSRVVMVTQAGIEILDRNGIKQKSTVIRPALVSDGASVTTSGETIWLTNAKSRKIEVLKTDGTTLRTIDNALSAGCFYKPTITLASDGYGCQEMVVIENGEVGAYHAADGVRGLVYGNVTVPALTEHGTFSLSYLSHWGDEAVLVRRSSDGPNGSPSVANFFLRSREPGLTALLLRQ